MTISTLRVDHKNYGFFIRQDRFNGTWFGYEWERRSCLQVDSTCTAGPMTESEAAEWIAAC